MLITDISSLTEAGNCIYQCVFYLCEQACCLFNQRYLCQLSLTVWCHCNVEARIVNWLPIMVGYHIHQKGRETALSMNSVLIIELIRGTPCHANQETSIHTMAAYQHGERLQVAMVT